MLSWKTGARSEALAEFAERHLLSHSLASRRITTIILLQNVSDRVLKQVDLEAGEFRWLRTVSPKRSPSESERGMLPSGLPRHLVLRGQALSHASASRATLQLVALASQTHFDIGSRPLRREVEFGRFRLMPNYGNE